MRLLRRVLLVVVSGLALVYGGALIFGRGGKGEFSPLTLETRTRSELVLPFTRVPIYRSPWQYHTSDLASYLRAKGYWTPVAGGDAKWLPMFRWMQWKDGHSLLHRELVMRHSVWIEWSDERPVAASVFWPRVLERLRMNDGRDVVYAWMSYGISAKTAADVEAILSKFDLPKR
jgi:hypothetical protein